VCLVCVRFPQLSVAHSRESREIHIKFVFDCRMVATGSSQDVALTVVLVLTAALWTTAPHMAQLPWARLALGEPPIADLIQADLLLEEVPTNVTGNESQQQHQHVFLDFPSQLEAAFSGERHVSAQQPLATTVFAGPAPSRVTGIHDDHRRLEAARVRLVLSKDKSQAFPIERELAHVKMDLGQPAAALSLYEQASAHAETGAKRLAVLSDIGEAHLRRGNPAASIQHLEGVLGAVPDLASAPPGVMAELHERLGRAHHASTSEWDFGESHERKAANHYSKALLAHVGHPDLESEQSELTATQMERLASGEGPVAGRRLRAPSPPPQQTQDEGRQAALPLSNRVRSFIDELMPEHAEAEVFKDLEALLGDRASGEEVAATLVLLGQVRRAQECYDAAAELYATALGLALRATGAGSTAASDAYRGLSFCQAAFHGMGRPEDAVAIFEGAVAVADAAQIAAEHSERKSMERRLKANAFPEISQPMPNMQCRSSGKDSQVLDLVSRALATQ